ncbi:DUF2635 domain-containing protein [Neisseria blantyrii]|uniref:DUF2635 domain-containing protein n=1 Tax=Neisseria blantyrii TaxID=2830647 RepID=UPI0035715EE9
MIKVRAAEGLRVPMEGMPHEYIGRETAEVDGESLYYRRLLDEGSLVAEEAAGAKRKGAE